jgi:hypothetical protein
VAYILDADLTNEYIQSLITRANFTDATGEYYPDLIGQMYIIRSLNGVETTYYDRGQIRDEMIRQYLIQQNS